MGGSVPGGSTKSPIPRGARLAFGSAQGSVGDADELGELLALLIDTARRGDADFVA